MLAICFASDPADIEAIAEPWKALEARCELGSISFQRHDWCAHWMRVYGGTSGTVKPLVATAWQNETLVGVLPLSIHTNSLGLRRAQSLGSPQGQYSSLIVDGTVDAAQILSATTDALRRKGLADIVVLEPVPGGIAKGADGIEPAGSSFVLDLTGFDDFTAYEASLSRVTRKGLRRKLKKLEAEGAVTFELMDVGTSDYSALCDVMLDWKQQTLAASGRVGSDIVCSSFRQFLKQIAASDRPNGLSPFCHVLKLDGRPIAGQLMFREGDTLVGYFSAYDPAFAGFSPGRLEMHRLVHWMFAKGLGLYDFLANSEDYKRSIANREIALYRIEQPLTAKGRVLAGFSADHAKRRTKALIAALPPGMRQFVANAARLALQLNSSNTHNQPSPVGERSEVN